MGRAPTTPAADIDAQSVSMRPMRVAVPRGMVMARGVAVSTSANRNSLKVTMIAKIAVDHGGLLEIERNLAEEAFHHPDAEGDVERRVGDDQPEPGVEQAEPQHQQVDRDEDDHGRHDAQRQQRQPDPALELEAQAEARDGVGAERTGGERQRYRDRGYRDGVEQEVAELLLREQVHVVPERRRMRIERAILRDLAVRLERGRHHPVDRQQHDRQDDDGEDGAGDAGDHAVSTRRNRRTAASARASTRRPMVTNSAAA